MNQLTANELKTKGVSLLKDSLNNEEAMITVRGESKYVVMDMKRYNRLRECELEVAYAESIQDLEDENYVKESVENHLKRLENEI